MFDKSICSGMVLKAIIFGLLICMSGCSDSVEQAHEVERRSMQNLEEGVVRVDIHGTRFDVPVRYMYVEGFVKHNMYVDRVVGGVVKHGRWPEPKQGITKVGHLNIDALLPDMRPYSEEDRAKFEELGRGEKISITISHDSKQWQEVFNNNLLRLPDEYHVEHPPTDEAPGLKYYAGTGPRADWFFSPDSSYPVRIICTNPRDTVPSPGCSVNSFYRNNLLLSYSYGKSYLPQWRQIDERVRALFDQFAQVGNQFDQKGE